MYKDQHLGTPSLDIAGNGRKCGSVSSGKFFRQKNEKNVCDIEHAKGSFFKLLKQKSLESQKNSEIFIDTRVLSDESLAKSETFSFNEIEASGILLASGISERAFEVLFPGLQKSLYQSHAKEASGAFSLLNALKSSKLVKGNDLFCLSISNSEGVLKIISKEWSIRAFISKKSQISKIRVDTKNLDFFNSFVCSISKLKSLLVQSYGFDSISLEISLDDDSKLGQVSSRYRFHGQHASPKKISSVGFLQADSVSSRNLDILL